MQQSGILFAALGGASTAYAQGGPPYKAECAEAEARAHAQARGRTWLNHEGVIATVGPITGTDSRNETVGEESGEIEVDVVVNNSYIHTVAGVETTSENLGAPRCTYGSNVSVTVKESASEIFQTSNPDDRHGGYQQITDLVRDGHYGVWFAPGTKEKSLTIPIADNERPNEDVTVTFSLRPFTRWEHYGIDAPRTAFMVNVTITDDDQTNSAIVLSWCDGGNGSVTEGGFASIPICASQPAIEDYTIKFSDQVNVGGTTPDGLRIARYDYQQLSDDAAVNTAVMRAGQTRTELPICTKETPAILSLYVDNCEVYDPDDGTVQIASFENIKADGFTGQIERSERVLIRVASVEGIAANEIDMNQVDTGDHYTLTILDDDHFKQALKLEVTDLEDEGTYHVDWLKAHGAGENPDPANGTFYQDGQLYLRWTIGWVNAEGIKWATISKTDPVIDVCLVPWEIQIAEVEVVEDLANLMPQAAVSASPGGIIESFTCSWSTSNRAHWTQGIHYDQIPPGVHKLVVRIKPGAYAKFGAHRNFQTYTLYIDGGDAEPRPNPVSFRFSESVAAEGGSNLLVIDRPVTTQNTLTTRTVHVDVTESRQGLYRFSNQHNSGVHADLLRDWGATSCEDSSVACEGGKLRSVTFGLGEAQKKILFITEWNGTLQGSPGTITVRSVKTREVPVLDSNGVPTGNTTTERVAGQHDPEVTGPKTASFQVRDGEQYLRAESDLTGRFTGAPAGHQGIGSSFTMRLRFAPSLKHGVTYRQLTTEMPLTGGYQTSGRIVFGHNTIVPKARRIRGTFSSKEDRRYYLNREWELTVEPTHDYEPLKVLVPGVGLCNKATAKDGYLHPYGVQHEEEKVPTILPDGAVVAQICTPHHGKPLRQNIEVIVPSHVPVISMEDLTDGVLEVDEGTTANVRFRLNRAATVPITFSYQTVALTAQSGSDFTAITNGSITFTPGQTRKTVQLVLIDNNIDDSGRLLYIRTSSGSTDLAANAGFKTVQVLNEHGRASSQERMK